jgi:hypothetical protein
LEKIQNKMNKQPPWWQIIAVLVSILIPVCIGLISMSNKQSAQEQRLLRLETEQFNNQIKVEKEFDKMGAKMDQLNATSTRILIELQNKADRK